MKTDVRVNWRELLVAAGADPNISTAKGNMTWCTNLWLVNGFVTASLEASRRAEEHGKFVVVYERERLLVDTPEAAIACGLERMAEGLSRFAAGLDSERARLGPYATPKATIKD